MNQLESTPVQANLLQTYSGILIDVFNAKPEDILIDDIAHALSNLCRFGGHANEFYSVAEHCYRGSFLCSGHELAFLLHDATEAYLVDIPRPIKRRLEEYKIIENNLEAIIFQKFGLPFPYDPFVKEIDNYMLFKEEKYLLQKNYSPTEYLEPFSPKEAKAKFLERFVELYNKK